ncbi:hypothetical protein [Oricola sp.]|uniref:hypothetical protein n=1 Tax=Oricola sp. TaxID=1979950 RepID=UPI0035144F18
MSAVPALLPAAMATVLAAPAGWMDVDSQYGGILPEMTIRAAESAHDWPFSVEKGTLTCVEMGRQKVVLFSEPWREDVPQEYGDMTLPRSVVVSTNPIALLASIEDRALYRPFDSLETLIVRLAPFEEMGRALCDGDAEAEREI